MTEQNFGRWRACLGDPIEESQAEDEFHTLLSRYAESHRAYHNLHHITASLGHLDSVKDALAEPGRVELAIWYHDAIYKPTSSTNEADSAALARAGLSRLQVAESCVSRVEQLILVTKHPSTPADEDERYLVDIDLAILGAPESAYAAYERGIRAEYRWVPSPVYRRERAKVLRGFLEAPSIYRTAHFYNLLEEAARKNLIGALAELGG